MYLKSIILGLLVLPLSFLNAQLPESSLDQLLEDAIEAFAVPGISLGIIEDGKTIYAKGKGVRSLKNNKAMNDKTLVGVASNSKGFTCFALAMMVDEGKLKWDDKVRSIIPEFQLSDPWVTAEFTIKDLVTHRSGFPLGAGDLMFFPDGNDFKTADVIAGVKHLKPETSFRSQYRYNNNMYIIAGEVLKRVSGMTWEEFIEKRIMKPVGMLSSKAAHSRVTDMSNIIDAHAPLDDGKVVAIPHDWSDTANPAGGIMSNIQDMLTWAEFLMNDAVTKNGKRLLSKEQMNNLWQLHMPIKVRPGNSYDTQFRGYGLGWFVSDVGGFKEVTHTGGLLGTVTQFILFPKKKLGIVVLTNQMSGAAFRAVSNTVKDSYLGYPNRDWVKKYEPRVRAFHERCDSVQAAVYAQVDQFSKSQCTRNHSDIIGTYTDPWFGDVYISQVGKELRIRSKRSPRLTGKLLPYSPTSYVARWNDRSYDADVFVNFSFNNQGEATGAKMKAISDITDFSFDFHNLNFKRTSKK